MDPKNNIKITVDDDLLDECEISLISSLGMDAKEMTELKAELLKKEEPNGNGSSSLLVGWKFGEKFAKIEQKMVEMGKELGELRGKKAELNKDCAGLKAQIDRLKAEKDSKKREFEELKAKIDKHLAGENGQFNTAKDVERRKFEELKAGIDREKTSIMLIILFGFLFFAGFCCIFSYKLMIEKINEMKAEFVQKNADFEGKIASKDCEMEKMKIEIHELKTANWGLMANVRELNIGNDEINGTICKLGEGIVKMSEEFVGMLKEENKNHMKKLANLTERIDATEFILFRSNKWNAADSGPKLYVSEGGLVVKHSGPFEVNTIRAISPILQFTLAAKKPSIAAYFEVKIVRKDPASTTYNIDIGFCTKQFPFKGEWLGDVENSIGIHSKNRILVNKKYIEFGNAHENFKAGDVIGIGIIHFPNSTMMKCFSMCNGQLLGTIDLPDNFASLQLFPAATLYDAGDLIRANFGQKEWRFNPNQLLK